MRKNTGNIKLNKRLVLIRIIFLGLLLKCAFLTILTFNEALYADTVLPSTAIYEEEVKQTKYYIPQNLENARNLTPARIGALAFIWCILIFIIWLIGIFLKSERWLIKMGYYNDDSLQRFKNREVSDLKKNETLNNI